MFQRGFGHIKSSRYCCSKRQLKLFVGDFLRGFRASVEIGRVVDKNIQLAKPLYRFGDCAPAESGVRHIAARNE